MRDRHRDHRERSAHAATSGLMLVVVALLSCGEPRATSQAQSRARRVREAAKTWQQIGNNLGCPSVEQLASANLLEAVENDAWGGRFEITCPDGDVVVTSAGPDRERGTEDDVSVR